MNCHFARLAYLGILVLITLKRADSFDIEIAQFKGLAEKVSGLAEKVSGLERSIASKDTEIALLKEQLNVSHNLHYLDMIAKFCMRNLLIT